MRGTTILAINGHVPDLLFCAMHSCWEWLVFLRVLNLLAMRAHQDTREITCLS
jgi:hypothetical protein